MNLNIVQFSFNAIFDQVNDDIQVGHPVYQKKLNRSEIIF